MTEQTGGVVLERRGLSIGPWLTYLRALLSQSATGLASSDAEPRQRCDFYIELGHGAPWVRVLGEDDWLEMDDASLSALKGALKGGKIDLVLSDEACIDLTFEVPPGLLPEVTRMIEAEILYRSPFAENAALAIWEAHEAPSGGWQVIAALTLEDQVKELVAALAEYQIEIASVVRKGASGTLHKSPPWLVNCTDEAPSPLALFRSLSPALQAALAGAVLFAASTTAHWGHATFSDWSLSDDAARAQTELRQSAAASSRLRGLDASLAMSTEVLALTGTLTELLPDGIWLDQIIIDGTEVTLVGFAPSAAEVTRLLTDLPTLNDIKFASPVIRDNSQSIERFRISATITNGSAT
ncbi:MAG: PilN domain-containing protein [Pseudomonadota bacterium]